MQAEFRILPYRGPIHRTSIDLQTIADLDREISLSGRGNPSKLPDKSGEVTDKSDLYKVLALPSSMVNVHKGNESLSVLFGKFH